MINLNFCNEKGQGPGQRSIGETPITKMMNRTHTRSASHGGVLATTGTARPDSLNWMGGPTVGAGGSGTISRPSALKKPGHQRAFSQGQVVEVQRGSGHPVSSHSRVGSKTDFILPPGHRDDVPRLPTSAKAPSFRGHSRQASRYL